LTLCSPSDGLPIQTLEQCPILVSDKYDAPILHG
jgi:hypothetical protein